MATSLELSLYRGDAKTLLAFNLPKSAAKTLAGFSIRCEPEGKDPYYLLNTLRFEHPEQHAQDATEPAGSSLNAPFQKLRWLHVPGSAHQGLSPFFGPYAYTVTPRYFDEKGSMLPLDPKLGATKTIEVGPFSTKSLKAGFTRGYTQSQAFVHHFGLKAAIRPPGNGLLLDTSQVSGQNAKGERFTFEQEYEWLGYTARQRIFELVEEVVAKKDLVLSVFAYDLNEPDLAARLLTLAKQGRIRVVLDNADLHKSTPKKTSAEDEFERAFKRAQTGSAAIVRGKFGRFSHDKVLIVAKKTGPTPVRVLTGSTNFSITGLYVNSNHVLVFDDPAVAAKYQEVFDLAFTTQAERAAFVDSPLSSETATFSSAKTPSVSITFSPHASKDAKAVLDAMVTRIDAERKEKRGSVLFAVMETGKKSTGPVFPALRDLHADQSIFSFGITDTTDGISLYEPGRPDGVLVTGKPTSTQLPPPFDQVPGVGIGHQIHHKFVVCGFNGEAPVVYCGSSNLALGGEGDNGDNLIAIRDGEVATAFAIEALALVDHFQFLDRHATKAQEKSKKPAPKKPSQPPTNKTAAARQAGWFLGVDDRWARSYYDPNDLHFVDRELFAG